MVLLIICDGQTAPLNTQVQSFSYICCLLDTRVIPFSMLGCEFMFSWVVAELDLLGLTRVCFVGEYVMVFQCPEPF